MKAASKKVPAIEFVRLCKKRVPKARTLKLAQKLFKALATHKTLKKARVKNFDIPDLTLVFLDASQARKINRQFRSKNYATDILSFASDTQGQGLGELVFCEPVLRRQAREHGLSFQRELDYLLIHGFLHLLGFEHEKSRKEELKMMNLQDRLFAKFK